MIKLVCSDVDGTLLPDGTSDLNPEYFDEIRRLKAKGILFAAVSGRAYSSCSKLFAPVIDDILFVCDNGAVTIFQGKVLAAHYIDQTLAKEAATEIEDIPGCRAYISAVKTGYVPADATELYTWLIDGYHLDIERLERMPEDMPPDDVVGVTLYHPTNAEGVASQGFYAKWNHHPEVDLVCSGKQWMNLSSKNINKGSALKAIQSLYNITPEETMAFGDNLNDAGMLRMAYYSYAIGNAREEVRAMARYLADTNINDGVLQILRTL